MSKTFIATKWQLAYFNSAENTAIPSESACLRHFTCISWLILWFSDPQETKTTKLANTHLLYKKGIVRDGRNTCKVNLRCHLLCENCPDLQPDSVAPPLPLPGRIHFCLVVGKGSNQTYLSRPKVHCFMVIDVSVDVNPKPSKMSCLFFIRKLRSVLTIWKILLWRNIYMIFKVFNLEIEQALLRWKNWFGTHCPDSTGYLHRHVITGLYSLPGFLCFKGPVLLDDLHVFFFFFTSRLYNSKKIREVLRI